LAFKHWVKFNKEKDQEAKSKKIMEMEQNKMEMEKGLPTHSLLLKEKHNFIEYQKILH
jgi:hypothetical protein